MPRLGSLLARAGVLLVPGIVASQSLPVQTATLRYHR